MATRINGVNGSPLFGSPLNVSITADSPAGDITFHQVKLTVTAHIQNGTARDYEFARPVRNGETVLIDICTALQAAFSAYVYESTPPGAYPYVAFSLKAWDEYVLNGESHTTTAAELGGMRALAGAFSDMERLIAGDGGRATAKFSRKPNTSPEIVMVGEQYVHAVDMEVTIGNITHGQQSAVTNITTEGMLTIDGRQVCRSGWRHRPIPVPIHQRTGRNGERVGEGAAHVGNEHYIREARHFAARDVRHLFTRYDEEAERPRDVAHDQRSRGRGMAVVVHP